MKTCEFCGRSIVRPRSNQKFCSGTSCRQRNHRKFNPESRTVRRLRELVLALARQVWPDVDTLRMALIASVTAQSDRGGK